MLGAKETATKPTKGVGRIKSYRYEQSKKCSSNKRKGRIDLHESLKMNKINGEPMSQEILSEFKRIKLLGISIIKS